MKMQFAHIFLLILEYKKPETPKFDFHHLAEAATTHNGSSDEEASSPEKTRDAYVVSHAWRYILESSRYGHFSHVTFLSSLDYIFVCKHDNSFIFNPMHNICIYLYTYIAAEELSFFNRWNFMIFLFMNILLNLTNITDNFSSHFEFRVASLCSRKWSEILTRIVNTLFFLTTKYFWMTFH